MATFLKNSGLSFLEDTGTYILGIILASLELAAGILILINKQLFYAYTFLAFIMFMALILVWIPGIPKEWMNVMIHIALLTTLAGLAMNEKNK